VNEANDKKITQNLAELTARFNKMYASPKILLVDDNENDFQALVKMFKVFGVQMFYSPSVDGAIDLLATNNFSIILLDWKFPGGDGGLLMDHLNEHHIPIPVAIYSGFIDSNTLTDVAKKRVVAVITKPITFDQISNLVSMFKLA
jgi:DNA-binding NtrC family response regulator